MQHHDLLTLDLHRRKENHCISRFAQKYVLGCPAVAGMQQCCINAVFYLCLDWSCKLGRCCMVLSDHKDSRCDKPFNIANNHIHL
ncbi:hypothetical protein QQG55_13325 [Brugia pahangi]